MAAKKKTTGNTKRKKNPTQNSRSNPIVAEIVFLVVLVLAILILISLFGWGGVVGRAISYVLFGLFGAVSYVFPILLVFIGGLVILNADNAMIRHKAWYGLGFYLTVCGIVQWFFNSDVKEVWETFSYSAENHSRGGFFGGLLSFELSKLLGRVGDLVLLIGLLLLFFILFSRKLLFSGMNRKVKDKHEEFSKRSAINREEKQLRKEEERQKRFEELQNRRMNVHTFDTTNRQEAEAHAAPVTEIPKPAEEKPSRRRKKEVKETAEMEQVSPAMSGSEAEAERVLADIHIRGINRPDASDGNIFEKELEAKFGKHEEPALAPDPMTAEAFPGGKDPLSQETETMPDSLREMVPDRPKEIEPEPEAALPEEKPVKEAVKEESKAPEEAETAPDKPPVPPEIPYVFPPLDLLSKPKSGARVMSDKDLKATALKLKDTLDSFGVGVSLGDISVGPSVTRYELVPDQGVKVSRITGLTDDIKLSLAASDIRIEAPIPGKSAVGIEVPNAKRVTITLRELLESDEFHNAKSKVTFAVGKDISGKTVVTDIAKMPHLLVAGSTGSGKSVLINTLIMSIIYKANPNDVKLIMVDPKMVEFMAYAEIPHLMIPVVEDPKKASAALAWAVAEMEKRYKKFSELGVRDLEAYNNKIKKVKSKDDPEFQRMPQIVIIVDEFADLMMVASHDVEESVVRLAQKARAAGIHLVLATQRPSVNVITGIIKANVPSRIALSVSSQIDSRTIIDSAGAEKLLGNGDMLFAPVTLPEPIRVQGAFVSDDDRDKVVAFLKEHSGAAYDENVTASIETVQAESSGGAAPEAAAPTNGRDEYFEEAGRFIIEKNKASIGALQRAFRIGFNRAARIMDQLSDAGVVGPEEGTKAREILMTKESFEAFLANEGEA